MSTRFIALHCGEDTQALLENHPNAFLLLTQIAMRAKWKDCPILKLKAGQAFIGDWQEAGLRSEKAYRYAKEVLADCELATFKGASKGTIATLADTRIYSITNDPRGGQKGELGADKGRTRGGQGATNHTDTQNTQTPFALNGENSDSPQKISWSLESGFTGITEKDRREWEAAFPAVNIDRQLAAASLWLKDNPKKRKQLVGKFITGWLSRNQERGGDIPSNPTSAPADIIVINGRAMTKQ